MKQTITRFLIAALILAVGNVAYAQRIQQKLGRGVVAVKRNSERSVTSGWEGCLVSWRKLAQDPEDTKFNVYINGALKATTKKTNYKPTSLTDGDVIKVVPVVNGKEQADDAGTFTYSTSNQPYSNTFMHITFTSDVQNGYAVPFIWPADLDGDGEMDYVVAQVSTDEVNRCDKVQAYKADGTHLWTIDVGHNVWLCGGQNDMILAYDINCDGKAEVIMKTSDETMFSDGKYCFGGSDPDTDGDGISNYLSSVYSGNRVPPFYISVIDGLTGKEMSTAELDYSKVTDGSDKYSRTNRSAYRTDNYGTEYSFMQGHFAIAYTDGIHPAVMMECLDRTTDGSHHNYCFAFNYDWNSGEPSNWHHSWTWSRNDKTPWPAEFHMVRVADGDGDGIDEMFAGGYAVNPVKDMVFSAGIGHGDRFRLSDIDPTRPGMEVFAIQQSNLMGQVLYDASNGEHIKEWYMASVADVGRGECMDVDSTHLGYEIYSTMGNLYSCTGEVIQSGSTSYPYEGLWWDGNLLREVANSPGGSGYGSNVMITDYNKSRYCEPSQEGNWAVHYGWGARPTFWGDITGDWREEIILLENEADGSGVGVNKGLIGYSTNIGTPYSIYCLQEDPHYRLDCTTRGYYQSPNTSFYLGHGMKEPPLPPCMVTDLRYKSGNWAVGTSAFTDFNMNNAIAYANGKSVIFDISGDNSATIELNGTLTPSETYFMVPKEHDYTFGGSGAIGGTGNVWKSMKGTATLNNDITTTGKVVVSEGTLIINGTVSSPVDLKALGTLGGNATINGDVNFEGALNYEGCRLAPGDADNYGTMTFGKDLTITDGTYVQLKAKSDASACDKIAVNGNLKLKGVVTFTIVSDEARLSEGEYVLMECAGTISATEDNIKTRGLVGMKYSVDIQDNKIVLKVEGTRDPAENVVWNGTVDGNWDYQTDNFKVEDEATSFVADDVVTFPDGATTSTVNITDMMPVNGAVFTNDNDTYVMKGEGGISGEGGLTKTGNGILDINTINDYTGKTIISGGTVYVRNLSFAGTGGSLGAASNAASNWQFSNCELRFFETNGATDHNMQVNDTVAFNVTTGTTSLNGLVSGGSGSVIHKKGSGQLNFNYAGVNTASGFILQGGTVAQGAWNTYFCRQGGKFRMKGGTVVMLYNANSTSAIPNFNYSCIVDSGTNNTINCSYRNYVTGSFTGKGNLTFAIPYVRTDISSNFSNFEGKVIFKKLSDSGQGRLSAAMNLSKATVQINDISLGHYATGSGSAQSYTSNFGNLIGTDTNGNLCNGTYNIGALGEDGTYAGTLTANLINKVGEGVWSITGTGSSSPIIVKEGYLSVDASGANATTGTITVNSGGTVLGSGQTKAVTVKSGGVLAAGKPTSITTSKISIGTINVNAGGIIRVRGRAATSRDYFISSGNVTLNSPVFRMERLSGEWTVDKDYKVFDCDGTIKLNGTPTFEPEVPMTGYMWDYSSLESDGVIRVVADPTAVNGINADDADAEIYDMSGRKVSHPSKNGNYIINGKKVLVK